MNRIKFLAAVFPLLAVLATSCSNKKNAVNALAAERFLPKTFADIGAMRSSEIRTFYGDSLWRYIDGGAEQYHLYNFVEVATADYKMDTAEFTLDIYLFDNAVDAYGLYSMVRPDNPTLTRLGVQGFVSVGNLCFVKGMYMIKLIGFDESDETGIALAKAANEVNKLIPGTTNHPSAFGLFPADNKIQTTDKLFAKSFLGRKFLTRIYSQGYLLDGDSVTLFLSRDTPKAKLLQWSKYDADRGLIELISDDFPFDKGGAFVTEDDYYGKIIAGLRKGMLVGMVGYSEKHKEFLADWLRSLP